MLEYKPLNYYVKQVNINAKHVSLNIAIYLICTIYVTSLYYFKAIILILKKT